MVFWKEILSQNLHNCKCMYRFHHSYELQGDKNQESERPLTAVCEEFLRSKGFVFCLFVYPHLNFPLINEIDFVFVSVEKR